MLIKNIKVVILGDKSVGKISLGRNYFGQSFDTNYLATIGVDFSVVRQTITHKDQEISVHCSLWDLAGHTNFEKFLPSYIKRTDGTIMVYSLHDMETLDNIDVWYKRVFEINEGPVTNLVGNKWDLVDDSEINENQINNTVTHCEQLLMIFLRNPSIT